jgi:hypothetical protein
MLARVPERPDCNTTTCNATESPKTIKFAPPEQPSAESKTTMAKTTAKPARRKQSNNQPRQPSSKKMQPVDSEMLEAISYDEATGTLKATFRKTSETYEYTEVPRQVYEELLAAESKGRFFQKWVIGKSYPFRKVA